MRTWRCKLIFLLIVFFAGFATAVYCVAPAPDAKTGPPMKKGLANSALKSDDFAKSFNVNMHKCLSYSKDAAKRAGAYMKQKLDDKDQKAVAKK